MRGCVGLLTLALSGAAVLAGPAAVASPSRAGIAYVEGTAKSEPSVWIANASGGSPRKLGQGDSPLLSPNGETVAVSDLGSRGNALSLYPVAGAPATGFFNIAHSMASPLAWSPDSRYLAVALTGNSVPSLSGYGLGVIDTDTGTAKTVATGPIYGASFAPGGSDTLVYARASSLSVTAATNIFTVAADGTGTQPITTDGLSADPVWGARGIAFDHEQLRTGYAPLDQIWLMQANGTGRTQITHVQVGRFVVGLVPLAFSADGTRLAAEYEGQDTSIGYSVSILTGAATQLKVGKKAVNAWGISRSGRSVLISVGGFQAPASDGTIARIPFSGGRPTSLLASGNFPSWNQ